MRRFLIIISFSLFSIAAIAARYEYSFHNTPVAQALSTLIKDHPESKITFIYNEMDDYKSNAQISTDNLKSAVNSIVGRNPISVSEKNGHLFVEAFQKGKYRYSGHLVNEFGEPVPNATVLLMNPKDSVVLTFGYTSKDGDFLIPCDRNPVLAKISCTSYETRLMKLTNTSSGNVRINTKAIELENVNVEAGIMRMTSDRTIYIPRQRQKNTAISAIDLLEQMGIPQIKISGTGTIENLFGKPVAVFIDYLPAGQEDLTGMNLQDVKKVEYLEYPSDPRFNGEKWVINFIMEKYFYGGYVRINGSECLNINNQTLTGIARYQYKSMTYDLAAYGNYSDSYHNGTDVTEVFRFPQSDGTIQEVERLSTTKSSRVEKETGRVSLKATYNSDNITARSILAGGISRTPVGVNAGDLVYRPEIYQNSSYYSEASSKDRFLSFNGSYIFKLPKGYVFSFTPQYTYSITAKNSAYYKDNDNPIFNGADDHTGKLSGIMNLNRNFGKYGGITLSLFGQFDDYHTVYTGSAQEDDRMKDQRYKADISYSLNAGGFYGDLEFGWVWDKNRFNNYKSVTSRPSVDLSLSYMFNQFHRLTAGFAYSSWAPNVSFKSEALISLDNLLSYTGNPYLKPSPHISADLAYNWVPSGNGFLQVFGNLWKVFDRYVYDYQPENNRMIRYIRQPMGKYQLIRYGVSGRLYLFNRSLALNASLSGTTAVNGLPYDYTHTDVAFDMSATYWLKDFYFSGKYSCPTTYSDGFMVGDLYKDKGYYYLMAGWANRSWNVRFTAMNFARWNYKAQQQYFSSEYYDRSFQAFGTQYHANLNISIAYTFSYGKKQKEERELDTRNAASSGILRN